MRRANLRKSLKMGIISIEELRREGNVKTMWLWQPRNQLRRLCLHLIGLRCGWNVLVLRWWRCDKNVLSMWMWVGRKSAAVLLVGFSPVRLPQDDKSHWFQQEKIFISGFYYSSRPSFCLPVGYYRRRLASEPHFGPLLAWHFTMEKTQAASASACARCQSWKSPKRLPKRTASGWHHACLLMLNVPEEMLLAASGCFSLAFSLKWYQKKKKKFSQMLFEDGEGRD